MNLGFKMYLWLLIFSNCRVACIRLVLLLTTIILKKCLKALKGNQNQVETGESSTHDWRKPQWVKRKKYSFSPEGNSQSSQPWMAKIKQEDTVLFAWYAKGWSLGIHSCWELRGGENPQKKRTTEEEGPKLAYKLPSDTSHFA